MPLDELDELDELEAIEMQKRVEQLKPKNHSGGSQSEARKR